MTFKTQESIRIPVRWGRDPKTRAAGQLLFDRISGEWTVEIPCEIPGGARLYLDLDLDEWDLPAGTRAIARALSSRPVSRRVHLHAIEFEFSSVDIGDIVSRVVVPAPDPILRESESDDDILTLDDEEMSELDSVARRLFDTLPPEARVRRDASPMESSLTPTARALPSQWRRALRASAIVAAAVLGVLLIAYLITWPRIR